MTVSVDVTAKAKLLTALNRPVALEIEIPGGWVAKIDHIIYKTSNTIASSIISITTRYMIVSRDQKEFPKFLRSSLGEESYVVPITGIRT